MLRLEGGVESHAPGPGALAEQRQEVAVAGPDLDDVLPLQRVALYQPLGELALVLAEHGGVMEGVQVAGAVVEQRGVEGAIPDRRTGAADGQLDAALRAGERLLAALPQPADHDRRRRDLEAEERVAPPAHGAARLGVALGLAGQTDPPGAALSGPTHPSRVSLRTRPEGYGPPRALASRDRSGASARHPRPA